MNTIFERSNIALVISLATLALTACGQGTTTSGTPGAAVLPPPYYVPTPTPSPTPSPGTGTPLGAIKEYTVEGYGNHARHVCIPVAPRQFGGKLKLRIIPRSNTIPLSPYFPSGYEPVFSGTSTKVYPDGTDKLQYSNYTKLRVRLSIQGTSTNWDYVANVDEPSAIGTYTNYLYQGTIPTYSGYESSSYPQYDAKPPLGSTPWDYHFDSFFGTSVASCTYWEKQKGLCSSVSRELRKAEFAGCGYGQQKILISDIISNAPCNNDPVNFCNGAEMQWVMDHQHWSITIQAETEATQPLTN